MSADSSPVGTVAGAADGPAAGVGTDRPGQSPRWRYPGSHPFSEAEDDKLRFFGRQAEAQELYLRILSVTLLVHFGRSGLGKTSLLLAGVFPQLRQKPLLPVLVRLNEPKERLVDAVARGMREACAHEGLDDDVPAEATELWELVASTMLWRDGLLLTPVLVFDQFEEVFTLRSPEFRTALAVELAALASGIPPARAGLPAGPPKPPPAKLVISLREDFLGPLEEFSRALPGLFRERLRLEPMRADAAREAIVKPAALLAMQGAVPYQVPPFRYDDALLDRMVHDLRGSSGVIEPFQLQLLCRHAERIAGEHCAHGRTDVVLTLADFTGRNDFATVLRDFYRHCIASLPWRRRGPAKRLCQDGLLDAEGHRLMLDVGQIRDGFDVDACTLDALEAQRLLRRERRLESVFYEISHDRLAASIHAARTFRLSAGMRRALIIAGVAVPAALVAALLWIRSVSAERDRAEQLAYFLLGEEVLGQVREAGLSDLLPLVELRTQALVDPDHASISLGLALRNSGDIARARGHGKAAAALFDRALAQFDTRAKPTSVPTATHLREAARTLGRLGDLKAEGGDLPGALQRHEQAGTLWTRLDTSPVTDADDCVAWADNRLRVSELHARLGEGDAARQGLAEAMAKALLLLVGPEAGAPACSLDLAPLFDHADPEPPAEAMALVARAALLAGELDADGDELDGALRLAEQVRLQKPLSAYARRAVVQAMVSRARPRGDPRRSLQAVDGTRIALGELSDMLRADPDNLPLRREQAGAQLLLGNLLATCCRDQPEPRDESQRLVLKALATMRQLVQTDPDNLAWQADLAWALRSRGAGPGDIDMRLRAFDESALVLQPLVDKDLRRARVSMAGLVMDRAAAVRDAAAPRRALEGYQRAVVMLERIRQAEPGSAVLLSRLQTAHTEVAGLARELNDAATEQAAQRQADDLRQQRQAQGARSREAAAALHLAWGDAALLRIRQSLDQRQTNEARSLSQQALAQWRAALARRPANAQDWLMLSRHLELLGQSGISPLRARTALSGAASAATDAASAASMSASASRVDDEAVGLGLPAMHAATVARSLSAGLPPGQRWTISAALSETRRTLVARLLKHSRYDDDVQHIAVAEVADAERDLADFGGAQAPLPVRRRLFEAQFRLGRVLLVRSQPGWEEAWLAARLTADQALADTATDTLWLGDVLRLQLALAKRLTEDGQPIKAAAAHQEAERLKRQLEERRGAGSTSATPAASVPAS